MYACKYMYVWVHTCTYIHAHMYPTPNFEQIPNLTPSCPRKDRMFEFFLAQKLNFCISNGYVSTYVLHTHMHAWVYLDQIFPQISDLAFLCSKNDRLFEFFARKLRIWSSKSNVCGRIHVQACTCVRMHTRMWSTWNFVQNSNLRSFCPKNDRMLEHFCVNLWIWHDSELV